MLIKIILRIVLTTLAVMLIAYFVPGIHVASFYTALLVALVWGLITLILRPILGLLTLPINLLTLGLFSFVLNALLFWLVAIFVPGFTIAGALPALEGSALLMVAGWIINAIL